MLNRLIASTLVLVLSLPVLSFAQVARLERLTMTNGTCTLQSGSGSPEGSRTGKVCDMYIDSASGTWYTKWTGTGNTGWAVGHNANAQVTGNLDVTGYTGAPGYVSQLTSWRVTGAGAADFRYLYTDELHAKSFIADLEQALAGGQVICKSVTTLGANFTNPATGGTATLTVRDLPSAANVATFQSGDYVGLRAFTRTAGSLSIAETFGVVTSYADQANGVQTWTFTRGSGANGGGMSTSTVVETDAIVIDYGVSGNGCHEVNAIDGSNSVNSPYAQTWVWTTSPIPANRTLRTRLGNLTGVTAVSNEYGLLAGTYGSGTGSSNPFIRSSSSGVFIHNATLRMFGGATETVRMDPSVPSFALGAAVPSAYGTGTGVWMGNDGGTYKMRIGNPAGNRLTWDGSVLTIVGVDGGITNINGANIQTGTISASKLTIGAGRNMIRNSDCVVGTEGWTMFTNSGVSIFQGKQAVGFSLNSASNTCWFGFAGTPAAATVSQQYLTTVIPTVPGNRYEASAYLGVLVSGNTLAQIQWLQSDGTTQISVDSGNTCTGATTGGTTLSAFCRSGLVATAPANAHNARLIISTTHTGAAGPVIFHVHNYFGEALANQTELTPWGPGGVTSIVGGMIEALSITAAEIAAGAITAAKISVSSLSAISANIGTITAGSISGVTISAGGGNVTLDSNGLAIVAGNGTPNKVRWSGGSTVFEFAGSLNLTSPGDISLSAGSGTVALQGSLIYPSSGDNTIDIGTSSVRFKTGYYVNLNLGSGSITKSGWAGGGTRYVCVDNSGVQFVQAGSC